MTSTLPRAALERIDGLCDRFEAAWKAGDRPRVEDYLGSVEQGAEREALAEELARVEAHYLRRLAGAATSGGATTTPLADTPRPAIASAAESPGPRPTVPGYEVLRELGRGGMGVVHLARQLRPCRLVALKMISAGVHAGPREVERFRGEADAVAQLQHPDIVQVYEVGEHDGCPYFAMEYVGGGSLDRALAGTPLPPRAAAALVERLALAIHHAHQRGIIHRDLKPANVLLQRADAPRAADDGAAAAAAAAAPPPTSSDRALAPKITDFGLAKLLDDRGSNVTRSGELLGTPNYMAPEQVTGSSSSGAAGAAGQVGVATDIYGLGAILYECLTGRPPFRAATALETVLQVQSIEPVSPSRLQPRCPRDLVTICLKCLAKQPRQRYASAAALAQDLRSFLDGRPILARPVGPLAQAVKWARRQPLVASLLAMLVLAVAAGVAAGSWFWWRAEEGWARAEVALSNEKAAQAERVATLDRLRVALAHREWLSGDARRAEALLDECTQERRASWEWRYLDRLRRSALLTLRGHANTVQCVAVRPDGRQLASGGHDGTVRLWDLSTGAGSVLGSHPGAAVMAVAYSPDARLLASSASHLGGVKVWDLASRTAHEIPFPGEGPVAIRPIAFDRDGRYLAVGSPRRVRVWDTVARRWEFEAPEPGIVWQVAFSRDGRFLATSSEKVRLRDWQARATEPKTWPETVAHTRDMQFSDDSSLLAFGALGGRLRVYDTGRGSDAFSVNAHPHTVSAVTIHPRGTRVATAGPEGQMHVWDVGLRKRLFTLHGHSGAVLDLQYTPDGSRLVSAGADHLVRVWDAIAGQEVTPLPPTDTRTLADVRLMAYGGGGGGPGGRLLAWGESAGRVGIWNVEFARREYVGDPRSSRSREPVVALAVDPGRPRVAWARSGEGARMWDAATRRETPLPDLGAGSIVGLAFSPDGSRLLAARATDEGLRVADLLAGRELMTLPRSGQTFTRAAWSADLRRLVTAEDGVRARAWDAATGAPLHDLGRQPARCIALSADGRIVAFGGVNGEVTAWDLVAGRQTMAAVGHATNVVGLAITPDGARVASAGSDNTAKLWDPRTGHEVLALRTDLHRHSALAFSPDGADLASVNVESHLQVWSTRPWPAAAPERQAVPR